MGGGEETFSKGGSLAQTHHKLIELLTENIKEEITAWNLPLGDKLWLPAAEALKSNTQCKRLTIYECDIGVGKHRSRTSPVIMQAHASSRAGAGARTHCVCVCVRVRAHTSHHRPRASALNVCAGLRRSCGIG
jgi:hypothetical protein